VVTPLPFIILDSWTNFVGHGNEGSEPGADVLHGGSTLGLLVFFYPQIRRVVEICCSSDGYGIILNEDLLVLATKDRDDSSGVAAIPERESGFGVFRIV
jgi:hypothetical protein